MYADILDFYLINIDKLEDKEKAHFLIRLFILGFPLKNEHLKFLYLYFNNELNFLNKKIHSFYNSYLDLNKSIYKRRFFRKESVRILDKLAFYEKTFVFLNFVKFFNNKIDNSILDSLDKEQIKKYQNFLHENLIHRFLLSTYAVNFLYLSNEFYGLFVNKKKLFEDIKTLKVQNIYDLDLLIYYLTHMIISESLFYTRSIENRGFYFNILDFLEKVIDKYYFFTSLDHKFEFLVCSRLVGKTSFLKQKILDEASFSIKNDNEIFLVDKHNFFASNSKVKDFDNSEHRNILFIMYHLLDS